MEAALRLWTGSLTNIASSILPKWLFSRTPLCFVVLPVSRSEQGQSKRLLLLDPDWQPLGDIPINLGRRHLTWDFSSSKGLEHIIYSTHALVDSSNIAGDGLQESASMDHADLSEGKLLELVEKALEVGNSSLQADGEGAAGNQGSEAASMPELRRGDHVRMVLSTDESTPGFEAAKKQLLAKGEDWV